MAKKPPVKRRSETVAQRPSKFELIFNRKKFNVLGKKVKGEAKSRIKAKSDSTEKVSDSRSLRVSLAVILPWKPSDLCLAMSYSESLHCWWSTSRGRGPMPSWTGALEVELRCQRLPGQIHMFVWLDLN